MTNQKTPPHPSLAHFQMHDPIMHALAKKFGPCTIRAKGREPFEALVSAVAHQQLHAKAAESILNRFLTLFPGEDFPTTQQVLTTPSETIRATGFSASKILAIHDIARKTEEGVIPSRAEAKKMSDEELIARLSEARGVGRWTVEMFLIFTLGRKDVLPVDDFGVRNGFRIAYQKRDMPRPIVLGAFGERWAPSRTAAAWYLWRAADESKKK